MRRYRGIAFAAAGLMFGMAAMSQGVGRNLPVVRILGESYYYYEVGKNESVYAIAKEMGWDPAVLARMNPNLTSPLEKGSVIYYPVGQTAASADADPAGSSDIAGSGSSRDSSGSVTHVVESGETVYSIARRYNVTTDAIYAANPKAQYGVRAGETLSIDAGSTLSHDEGGYLYHTVEAGETLYGLSQRFNTSVADIMKINPGVTESNFKAGSTIRIVPDSKRTRMVSRSVERERVVSVTNYRVGRKDTWMSISRATGVSPELLKEANPGVSVLQKGMVLAVPRTEVVTEQETVQAEDPRDATPEGRRELYEEVNGLDQQQTSSNVRVGLVLEDISSNKDMEFARGFILAVDHLRDAPYRTSVKLIDGASPQDSIVNALDGFRPDMIVTTHDKNYPAFIADYSAANDVKAINVFDVKNDWYASNPDIVQVLTPTEYFNANIARYAAQRFDGYTLIVAGEPDGEDTMLEGISSAMDAGGGRVVPVADLADLDVLPGEEYLIYGAASKKSDITSLLEKVITLREKAPESEIVLMGRPNWIAYADALGEKYSEAVVYIPSRFYFDSDLAASRTLINDYKEMYGHTPIKSYPVYAVAGYDVATYFIPGMAASGGDFNAVWPQAETLQTDFSLVRPNNWSGFYNPVVYLVKFNEFGNIDKIVVK